MKATLQDILNALNREQIRATYGAVAEVLGIPARSVGKRLGAPRAEASWVVRDTTGLPGDYQPSELHAQLTRRSTIIRTGAKLRKMLGTAPTVKCTCKETPELCPVHRK